MRDVYAGAEQTLIFLGPPNGDSDAAIDMFHLTGQTALRFKCFDPTVYHMNIAEKFVQEHLDSGPRDCTDSI